MCFVHVSVVFEILDCDARFQVNVTCKALRSSEQKQVFQFEGARKEIKDDTLKNEGVTISEFTFKPSMPEVVAVTHDRRVKAPKPTVAPPNLMGNVGMNLERCVLALGGAVYEIVEEGIKVSHKSKKHASALAASTVAVIPETKKRTAEKLNASNIPHFDLCGNCLEKCNENGMEFKPQQLGKFAAIFSKIRMV